MQKANMKSVGKRSGQHDSTSFSQFFNNLLEEIVEEVSCFSPQFILDLGCADGKMTHQFAKKFRNSQLIGADINAELIANAQKKYQGNNLNFLVINQIKNTFVAQFDLVVSYNIFNWLYDQSEVLQEIKNLLLVNGRAMLVIPLINKLHVLIELLSLTPRWRKFFGHLKEPKFFYTKREYLELISDVGLKINNHSTKYINQKFKKKDFIDLFLLKLPQLKALSVTEKTEFFNDVITSIAINSSTKNTIELLFPILKLNLTKLQD